MRLKLDENLGKPGLLLLRQAGHDVSTVVDENLCGASDEALIEACRPGARTLITLYKDFANILRFPPHRFAGIVVLRLREPLTLPSIEEALGRLCAAARNRLSPVDCGSSTPIGSVNLTPMRMSHDTLEPSSWLPSLLQLPGLLVVMAQHRKVALTVLCNDRLDGCGDRRVYPAAMRCQPPCVGNVARERTFEDVLDRLFRLPENGLPSRPPTLSCHQAS